MDEPFWEDAFRDLDTEHFGQPSERVITVLAKMSPGQWVLDAGCGSGGNAMEAAQRGMKVRAFDISEAGIGKLRARAGQQELAIDSWVGPLEDLRWDRTYGLVILNGVLQFVGEDAGDAFIRDAMAHTAPGGCHVISTFTDEAPVPEDLEPFVRRLFRPGELSRLYAGWEIVEDRRYIKSDEHPGGLRHTHAIEDFCARCPEEVGAVSADD